MEVNADPIGVRARRLLLLDLDGVIVLEVAAAGSVELVRLHRDLARSLQRFGCEVVVLTHRSAAEARTILEAAGLPVSELAAVLTAETILMEGLRRHQFGPLLRRGLRKSLVLSIVEERFAVDRSRIAFIDDRLDNLDDMAAQGVGLAMLAPSDWTEQCRLGTFDFGEAAEAFIAWTGHCAVGARVNLSRIEVEVETWRRSGLCTTASGGSLFNQLRKLGGRARRRMFPAPR